MTSERTRRFLAVLASLERERGFKPIRSSNEAGLMTFPREERPSGLGSLARLMVDIAKREFSNKHWIQIVERHGHG